MTEKITYIASNLKYLRKKKKLSQAELARILTFSRSNIAAYEAGNTEPNLKKVVQLSDFLEVGLRDFIMIDLSLPPSQENIPQVLQQVLKKNSQQLETFVERTTETKEMIAGFKQFFKLRMQSYPIVSAEIQTLANDFGNLIAVAEHLIETNQDILKALDEE